MKKPLLAQAAGHRIAVAIEDCEGFAMLEHARLRIRQSSTSPANDTVRDRRDSIVFGSSREFESSRPA